MTTTHEIIAGTDSDFMTVPHLTARGTQVEIGRRQAEQARRVYDWRPIPADPAMARARRAWFARYWPQHLARMQGAADLLGIDLEADEVYLDGLAGVPNGSACSASYYPPSATTDGRGVMGRNYDFFTTSASDLVAMVVGQPAAGGEEGPIASRPHVLTSLPEDGTATTLITMNELDGAMEGINSHGLAVALLLGDAENVTELPENGPQVGLSTIQLPRFVLDTCATAAEAQAALLAAKQYDDGVPLHYLIADRTGNAFIWERGHGGDEHVIRAAHGALCVTNHPVHRHGDPATLPEDNAESLLTYQRYRRLSERSAGTGLSAGRMREALDAVSLDATADVPYPIRTLWRTIFDLDAASMTTRFYLGDGPGGSLRYSPELEFAVPAPVPG